MKEISRSGNAGHAVLQKTWFGLRCLFYPRGRLGISRDRYWTYHRNAKSMYRKFVKVLIRSRSPRPMM